jgi:hypothetical protein
MATQKRFIAKNGLDNNAQTITNVATPVNTTDAVTKAYADLKPDLASTTPAALGVAAVGTGTTAARSDHVHASPTTISGNAGTATSIAGGVANNVPYQTAAGTTAFVPVSTAAGQVLTTAAAGGAPTWVTPTAIALSSAITGYAAGANTALAATDTILAAFGKLQGQVTARGVGTVTGVTATAPVSSSGGTAPIISMAAATTSVSGYLTSTDWNTFNGKYSTGGALGTPSSGTLTNCTFPTLNQNTTGSSGSCTGNAATATTLIGDQTNWASYRSSAVGNMLGWKNYGNGHVIFDASNGTSPTGSAVNNTNSAAAWSATYPTLMGWNGTQTYGVRVDSARISDSTSGSSASCTGNAATATTATNATNASYLNGTAQTSLFIGKVSNTVDINTANDAGSISVRGDATYPACMSFHRAGAYAINVGLSNANNFVIGGWSASSNAFSMTGGGALTMLNNITAYSDERLKKNWRDLPVNFVERLAKIKHGIYERTDQECTQVGVSAQSLQPLLPDAIMTQVDGMLSVSYGNAALVSAVQLAKEVVLLKEQSSTQSNTIELLIDAIKEQQIQIDELKELINKGNK